MSLKEEGFNHYWYANNKTLTLFLYLAGDFLFRFILFQSDGLFKSKRLQRLRESNRNVSTSGRVISAAVDGPAVTNLTEPVVIEFSPNQAQVRMYVIL